MEFCDRFADLDERRGRRLHDQKPFASFFYGGLPAVDGRDLRDNVDAGREAALDDMAGDLVRFFFRGGGGEDDAFVGHINHAAEFVGCKSKCSRLSDAAWAFTG